MEVREELIKSVLKSFIHDLNESGKPLSNEEGIVFAGALIDYLKGVYNYSPSVPEYNIEGYEFDEEEFIEEKLLNPFRQKMVPFIKSRLRLYFAKDDFSKALLFQKLKITEPLFSDEEYEEYIIRIYLILRRLKENLFLKPTNNNVENEAEANKLIENPEEMEKQGFKAKNKDYTRSRQILLYYFVLKAMNITRLDANAISLAEFGHALFYWPVDKVKNNDLYKKLCKAPYIHESDQENLKDLEYVKRQFEKIGHEQAITMVQKEIDSLKGK